MSSMTSLAEDLLKTRTIPELRERVNQLEKESNAKKTELQLMVGSKYHDFIQSADMINEMRGQVTTVEQQIELLWKCNQDLVQKGHNLLNLTVPQTNRKRKTVEVSTLLSDLTPASVWNSLNECNVFASAQSILTAAMLSTSSPSNSSLSSCFKFFSSDSQKLLASLKFSKQNRSDFRSIVNLAKTVSDDSELILLDGESYAHSASIARAKSLAALGITSQTSSSSLLQTYLSVADIRIQEVFEGDLCVKQHKGGAALHAPPPSVEVLLRGLTSLVTILQEVTMDLYLLFFVAIPGTAAGGVAAAAEEEGSGLIDHFVREIIQGSVAALQLYCDSVRSNSSDKSASKELSFDITTYLAFLQNSTPAVSVRDRVNEWLSTTLRKVTERCKGVLASITNASDVAMLQQRVWRTCTTITSSAAVTVGATAVASDAPHAKQQRERSDSLKVVVPSADVATAAGGGAVSADPFHASQYHYSQSVWDTACHELLLPANGALHHSHSRRGGAKHRGKAALTPKASSGQLNQQQHSNILYSTVFRISFMHQVERLLSSSCADILAAVKRTLVQALHMEGVTVDPTTFAVKSIACPPGVTSGPDSISSVRIFNVAEFIRRELEHLLTVLYLNSNGSHLLSSSAALEDSHAAPSGSAAGGGGTNDDPHAAATLTKVLHGHCSQLVGQLMIVLRTIGESCRDALLTRGALMSTSEWNGLFVAIKDAKSGKQQTLISKELQSLLKGYCTNPNMTMAHSQAQNKSSTAAASQFDSTPLLSSMLLVGRVAWLLKIRGQFLETSLRPLPTKKGAVPDSGLTQNSEDQFRSAFEIADTNGDGVINYSESIEAITALSNSETNPAASNLAANFPGISPSLTPSMTYGEFSLIAGGQLIVNSEQNPLKQLRSCLNHLVALSHATFACCVAVEEAKSLGDDLLVDLSLNSLKKGNLKDVERLFKISWVTKCVAGEMDDSMQVPSCCSTSLSSLWNAVNSRVAAACVSIDSMQREIESPFSNLSNTSLRSASFDASAATLDALDDEEESGGNANVLAVLSGLTAETSLPGGSKTSVSPMLSQVVSRLAFQLTLALIYRAYNSQLQQLKSTISTLTSESGGATKTAGLDSLLEDVSLQVVFDLAVMERQCPAYCCVSGPNSVTSIVATPTTFFAVLTNQWRTYLDSVTAELVLPLLEESVREYTGRVHLLYPPSGAVVSGSGSGSGTSNGKTTAASGAQSSSEQILSRIFPTLVAAAAPPSRFALLPLALMTAPTVIASTPTHAMMAGTPSKHGAANAAAPVRSGNIFSSNGSTHTSGAGTPVNVVTSSNNLAGMAGGGPNSGKATTSSIKWW